jgi:hypothetical protein
MEAAEKVAGGREAAGADLTWLQRFADEQRGEGAGGNGGGDEEPRAATSGGVGSVGGAAGAAHPAAEEDGEENEDVGGAPPAAPAPQQAQQAQQQARRQHRQGLPFSRWPQQKPRAAAAGVAAVQPQKRFSSASARKAAILANVDQATATAPTRAAGLGGAAAQQAQRQTAGERLAGWLVAALAERLSDPPTKLPGVFLCFFLGGGEVGAQYGWMVSTSALLRHVLLVFWLLRKLQHPTTPY